MDPQKILTSVKMKNHYDSDSDDLLEEFYKPALKNSVIYKRAVGYFSDSVLRACAQELSEFIEQDGKIYLVIGTFISEAELSSINPIQASEDEKKIIRARLISSLKRLAANSGETVAIIGKLIDAGIAEIRIAARTKGIYHEKYGIFQDTAGNRVAFIGSANETGAALGAQVNHESISVFSSDDTYTYEKYGLDLEKKFERLWNGELKKTRIYELDQAVLDTLKELTKTYVETNKINPHDHHEQLAPLSTIVDLRNYQKDALKKWQENSYIGILAMATGTGKTLVAINALQNFRRAVPNGFIIVVVPYQNLAVQWIQAIQDIGINSIPAFQDYRVWYAPLKNACLAAGSAKTQAPCVVAVEDTFKSDRFQELLTLVNSAQEKNHLLIADECHHFNDPQYLAYLPSYFRYRLGLSATPYDQFSEKYLDKYFKGVIFEFSLGQAIKEGYLCPYEYHVIEVSLDEEETERYEALTKKIGQFIGSEEKITPENIFKVQPLLLKRARIIGAAQDKLTQLSKLVKASGKQQYALVYCGDGSNEDDSGEQSRQINQVTQLLHELRWNVAKVTAEESLIEREKLISALKDQLIDVIVSIRVLDEGIDIPACRVAYFLASQRSERQHIQRRGRILRVFEGKEKATIYDFVVTRTMTNSLMCNALVKRELERVWRFASDAMNGANVIDSFRILAEKVGLSERE